VKGQFDRVITGQLSNDADYDRFEKMHNIFNECPLEKIFYG